ncbi:hypothetical protein OG21DRAFT_1490473 [Imleria badia]|nr:hypothetical protein OG21DRAFT_1490473 [Imleria badia]
MLDNLETSVQLDNDHIISQLQGMRTGDTLAFFICRHNATIILTKWENSTLCEAFELSPDKDDVEKMLEPLICLYPRLVVETPNEVFDSEDF